tara:strand:+ start:12 stop:512 length:501 start_codon:yes stop_codon:yes gene_type:complete
MTVFDINAINTFRNKFKGNILLLGFSPNINNFTRTKHYKILKGYCTDTYSYIIKVEFATYLYDKYYSKMLSFWAKKMLPLGHVDTLFLIYEVYAMYPMLYGQKDDKRYDSIFINKGFNKNTKPIVYFGFRVANLIYHKYLPSIPVVIIIFIITFLLYKNYKFPKLK